MLSDNENRRSLVDVGQPHFAPLGNRSCTDILIKLSSITIKTAIFIYKSAFSAIYYLPTLFIALKLRALLNSSSESFVETLTVRLSPAAKSNQLSEKCNKSPLSVACNSKARTNLSVETVISYRFVPTALIVCLILVCGSCRCLFSAKNVLLL